MTYEELERTIDWEWFRNLWEYMADEIEFFRCAEAAWNGLPFAQFDKGWQFRTVLHENRDVAEEEFIMAIMGV